MFKRSHKFLETQLYNIAFFSAKNPWETIALTIALTMILMGGFFSENFYIESKMENLYVPSESLAYVNLEYITKYFGNNYQELVLVHGTELGDNILTKKAFDAIWEVHNAILGVELNGKKYEDYCTMGGEGCYYLSPTNFWDDYADYNETVFTDEDVQEYCSAPTYADGSNVNRDGLFSQPVYNGTYDDDGFRLYSSQGLQMFYPLDAARISVKQAGEFELKVLEVMGVTGAPFAPVSRQPFDNIKVFVLTSRSTDDELLRIIFTDSPLIVVEYIVMAGYVTFCLSYGTNEIRNYVTTAGMTSVLLSTLAGYGLCAYLGVAFTTMTMVLPFILVGIGVDDMFIIIHTFRYVSLLAEHKDEPIYKRLAISVEKCGLSIIYTTATDVVAFALGAWSSIPAITYFCIYASIAVLFDFLFQITFFVACLSLDEERIAKNKRIAEEKAEELAIIEKEKELANQLKLGLPLLPSTNERSLPLVRLNFTTPANLVLSYIDSKQAKLDLEKHQYDKFKIVSPGTTSKQKTRKNQAQNIGSNGTDHMLTCLDLPSPSDVYDSVSCFVEAYSLTYGVGTSELLTELKLEKERQQNIEMLSSNKRRNYFVDNFENDYFQERNGRASLPPPSSLNSMEERSSFLLKDSDFAYWFKTKVHGAVPVRNVKKLWHDSFEWLTVSRYTQGRGGGGVIGEDTRMDVNEFVSVIEQWRKVKRGASTDHNLTASTGAISSSGGTATHSTTRTTSSGKGLAKQDGQGSKAGERDISSFDMKVGDKSMGQFETVDIDTFLENKTTNNIHHNYQEETKEELKEMEEEGEEKDWFHDSNNLESFEEEEEEDEDENKNKHMLIKQQENDLGSDDKNKDKLSRFDRFITAFIKFADTRSGKVVVMISFAVLTAFSCYNASLIEEKFDGAMVMPDNSYAGDFFRAASDLKLFWDYEFPFHVVFRNVDVTDPDIQKQMMELMVDLTKKKRIEGPSTFWLEDFLSWCTFEDDCEKFLTRDGYFDGKAEGGVNMRRFMHSFMSLKAFGHYEADIVFSDIVHNHYDDDASKAASSQLGEVVNGTKLVTVSRGLLSHTHVLTSSKKVDAMVSGYETCEKSPFGLKKAFNYSGIYIFVTQFQYIFDQTIFNAILCLCAVGAVSAFILSSTRSVMIILVTVAMIDFDLFGCIPLLHDYLNLITMICLNLAIGLMVDYLAHIMHYSCHASPTAESGPRPQVTAAVCQIGPSVLLGASTTLVGVLPLGFASSYIFRTFFKMFIATILLALLHAFFFLPTMMLMFPVQVQAKVHPTDKILDTPQETAARAGASITLQKKSSHTSSSSSSGLRRRNLTSWFTSSSSSSHAGLRPSDCEDEKQSLFQAKLLPTSTPRFESPFSISHNSLSGRLSSEGHGFDEVMDDDGLELQRDNYRLNEETSFSPFMASIAMRKSVLASHVPVAKTKVIEEFI